MIVPKISKLIYGGDYNPEQWDPAVWREDVKLMKEAGVNMVSLAIFSWALLEPREGEFDFGWLDEVMDLLAENGIAVDLATATAAQPAWMSLKYPDVLAVTEEGTTLSYGSRQVYCPNSPPTAGGSEAHRNHGPALQGSPRPGDVAHQQRVCLPHQGVLLRYLRRRLPGLAERAV
jgi:beta-galactosidase GanA